MSDRLTKVDWLQQGLRTLAAEGVSALKVGPMAARLGVSRGSFYWHFADIEAFRSDLLGYWQETATDQVIEALDARPGDLGRLRDLLRQAFGRRHGLDRAVRSWAAHDPEVAGIVGAVDDRRIAQIARLLVDAGLDATQANPRALLLYWAFLGQAVVADERHASMPTAAIDALTGLFLNRDGQT